jgi:hypothetical protein
MVAQRDPAPDGVFVNDLHAPSIRVKLDPPQGSSDSVPRGPTLVAPDQGLGAPNCLAVEAATSATTTPTTDSDWRVPLLAYLLDEILPANRTEARRIARCAKTYAAVNGKLYKCSSSAAGMLIKCIPTHQGKELLLEIHAGICGHHAVLRSLVSKAFRQGFY